MAKKHSTKTATKEALQSAEPKLQTFRSWNGINIKESPLGWNPIEFTDRGTSDFNQGDLPMNYLVLQNNVETTSSKCLETRNETVKIANAPLGREFTGVSCMRGEIVFAAFNDDSVRYFDIGNPEQGWVNVRIYDPDGGADHKWSCLACYLDSLIGLTEEAEMFTGSLTAIFDDDGSGQAPFSAAIYVPNPSTAPNVALMGDLEEGDVSRVSFRYCYCNKFGYTIGSPYQTVDVNASPVEWSALRYAKISGHAPLGYGITSVDIYCTMDENQDDIFIGHADVPENGNWSYNWLGALMDSTQWSNVPLTIPLENSTKGVDASFVNQHDGRLYYWGGTMKYRLWIGGNPGNEFSVARGVGGGYVDIEPGSGCEIHHTHKFKTYNGASIVTIMCGNENTGQVKRFNLLETNVSVTNEYSSNAYMTEEVSNVVGCNSDYGSGVWADGLYAVSRYGLAVTTQAMESQNQLRVQLVSDVIQPVFTGKISERLSNARMIHTDDVIYIVLAEAGTSSDTAEQVDLDHVVLCYDIYMKAWYTFTIEDQDRILHVFNFDSDRHREGIGVITTRAIKLIPNTGDNLESPCVMTSLIETGELAARQPQTAFMYVHQIEFRFDYFIGDADAIIEGIDYYGRRFRVEKHISWSKLKRNLTEWARVEMYVQSYRIVLKGKCHYRLTHINAKAYTQSNKIGVVWGYDDRSSYYDRDGDIAEIHHYLADYNNLRDALIP